MPLKLIYQVRPTMVNITQIINRDFRAQKVMMTVVVLKSLVMALSWYDVAVIMLFVVLLPSNYYDSLHSSSGQQGPATIMLLVRTTAQK